MTMHKKEYDAKQKELLTAAEVCVLVGISVYTLNNWYAFKREEPKNEYAKRIPNFIQEDTRTTRYWKREDISKLIAFKESIPKGVNGVMGSITQRYYKEVKNGKGRTIKKSGQVRKSKTAGKSVKKGS